MKFIIWRHEDAFGNSAEQVVNIARVLEGQDVYQQVEIVVEHEWQKSMALCIPGVSDDSIQVLGSDIEELLAKRPDGYLFPSVYGGASTYPAGWEDIGPWTGSLLDGSRFHDKGGFYRSDLVVQFKSRRWQQRNESRHTDAHRYVSEQKYGKLCLHYAELGYRVVRLGDTSQPKLPAHPNLFDVPYALGKSDLRDDLRFIVQSRLAVFTDSGLWPIAAGLGKPLVMGDVVSNLGSYRGLRYTRNLAFRTSRLPKDIFGWVSTDKTRLLHKQIYRGPRGLVLFRDSSFRALREAIDSHLEIAFA